MLFRLIFLIGHIKLIGVWFGEDQRTNTIKPHVCLQEIGLCLGILLTNLHSIMNTIGRTYVFSEEIDKHAFSITVSKSGEVSFSIQILLMQYIVSLCKSNW